MQICKVNIIIKFYLLFIHTVMLKYTLFKSDCAESPFKHILPKSKLARDLKYVFKRFVELSFFSNYYRYRYHYHYHYHYHYYYTHVYTRRKIVVSLRMGSPF